jgi:hypothetical protein
MSALLVWMPCDARPEGYGTVTSPRLWHREDDARCCRPEVALVGDEQYLVRGAACALLAASGLLALLPSVQLSFRPLQGVVGAPAR